MGAGASPAPSSAAMRRHAGRCGRRATAGKPWVGAVDVDTAAEAAAPRRAPPTVAGGGRKAGDAIVDALADVGGARKADSEGEERFGGVQGGATRECQGRAVARVSAPAGGRDGRWRDGPAACPWRLQSCAGGGR